MPQPSPSSEQRVLSEVKIKNEMERSLLEDQGKALPYTWHYYLLFIIILLAFNSPAPTSTRSKEQCSSAVPGAEWMFTQCFEIPQVKGVKCKALSLH